MLIVTCRQPLAFHYDCTVVHTATGATNSGVEKFAMQVMESSPPVSVGLTHHLLLHLVVIIIIIIR